MSAYVPSRIHFYYCTGGRLEVFDPLLMPEFQAVMTNPVCQCPLPPRATFRSLHSRAHAVQAACWSQHTAHNARTSSHARPPMPAMAPPSRRRRLQRQDTLLTANTHVHGCSKQPSALSRTLSKALNMTVATVSRRTGETYKNNRRTTVDVRTPGLLRAMTGNNLPPFWLCPRVVS